MSLPNLSAGNFLQRCNMQENITITYNYRSTVELLERMDFDVYLPSKGINLQRPLVWTQTQKEAWIESLILRRHIPLPSVILTAQDKYECIDGKQRLTTLLDYLLDKFSFCGYKYSELPREYKVQLDRRPLAVNRLIESFEVPLTDDQKIEWFCWINYAGTPQDKEHLEKLRKS